MPIAEMLLDFVQRIAIQKVAGFSARTAKAHWQLNQQMPKLNRCWNKVRSELEEVGLLYEPEDEEDGGYLEQIELQVSALPSGDEAGYIFDVGVPLHWKLAGYEEGVIYLPADLPDKAYVPGHTLTDTIRHEYAHAWYWVEPDFVDDIWFQKAFGASYLDKSQSPEEALAERLDGSPKFVRAWNKCRNDRECNALWRREFEQELSLIHI